MARNRLLAEEKRLARAKQRAEEEARKQKEAEEVAAAVAASQALDEDFVSLQETTSSQSHPNSSILNGFEEQMDVV